MVISSRIEPFIFFFTINTGKFALTEKFLQIGQVLFRLCQLLSDSGQDHLAVLNLTFAADRVLTAAVE